MPPPLGAVAGTAVSARPGGPARAAAAAGPPPASAGGGAGCAAEAPPPVRLTARRSAETDARTGGDIAQEPRGETRRGGMGGRGDTGRGKVLETWRERQGAATRGGQEKDEEVAGGGGKGRHKHAKERTHASQNGGSRVSGDEAGKRAAYQTRRRLRRI